MSRRPPAAWYDAQYDNRARIAEHPAILRRWAETSAAAYSAPAALAVRRDLRYGDGPAETLDLFPAAGRDAPLLVWIHGGYWRALGKRDQAFVAPPFVAAGAAVALLDYALCPAVRIEDIVRQTVQALAWLHRHAREHGIDPRRIVVAGHSAGGHLATMLLACQWPRVGDDLPRDLVGAALSISGVYELEPLRRAPFLAPDLRLDAAAVARLSPARLPPPRGPLAAVVGGRESEEFLRQHALIRRRWGDAVVPVCEVLPGRNHMDVLDDLIEPSARLHRLARGLLGCGAENG
ncbi:MAG: alpha/beta hydrolase [Proteobacteria bacterium]|nr:alpha/beta hydrolase [Pseudomonadota bacterium]